MPVTVRLPGALRDVTGGQTKLTASGGTLRDVIAEIDRRHPGFASRVLDEKGALRSYVNVYIGEDDARTRGEAVPRFLTAARSWSSRRWRAAADRSQAARPAAHAPRGDRRARPRVEATGVLRAALRRWRGRGSTRARSEYPSDTRNAL